MGANPPSLVDWDLAVSTARRLVRPGPATTREEARAVSRELRSLVPAAERHVADYTGLTIPDADIPVAVVDRPGWVSANVEGFQLMLAPLLEKLAERSAGRTAPASLIRSVGARVAGVQVGTILAYLASRVLGQFEVFVPSGDGRLTLVAPNIVETERRLDVDPHDFRLWVVLHEVTHRTQFTAVPWLREHFLGEIRAYVDAADLDPTAVLRRLRDAAAALRGHTDGGVLTALQSPEQQVVVARLQAFMSLLEGHGDVVMDGVGPAVVPTAQVIRERFDARRRTAGPVDRVVRRLLGLDLKLRQYEQGAAFVRHVIAEVGMAGFNRVWESPDTLPVAAEITDPAAWVRRLSPTQRRADGGA